MAAAIGLGTATFIRGYGIGNDASILDRAVIRRAIERGVRYIDTAGAYANGEAVLGSLSDLCKSCGVRICTKLGADPEKFNEDDFAASVDASLARLSATRVDTLLLHSVSKEALSSPSVVEALDRVKHAGKTSRIGASTYGVEPARLALRSSWCDAVQIEYSILNQSVLPALVPIKRPNQEIVARSVLCKGLLSNRSQNASVITRDVESDLVELERIAVSWGYLLPELAIRFALDTSGVDVVLVGVSSVGELETALHAVTSPGLDKQQIRRLQEFDRSDLACVHPERWTS